MRRRYLAYFLSCLMLLSSIGIGVFRRWCNCEKQLFVSVGAATKEHDCCKKLTKEHKQCAINKKHTSKDCCAQQSTINNQQSTTIQKKCCDTDSDYWVAQTAPVSHDIQLPIADLLPLVVPPFIFSPFSFANCSITTPHLSAFRAYQSRFIPPLLSGRDRLNWIQIYRC